jgi:hypothetical protein
LSANRLCAELEARAALLREDLRLASDRRFAEQFHWLYEAVRQLQLPGAAALHGRKVSAVRGATPFDTLLQHYPLQ